MAKANLRSKILLEAGKTLQVFQAPNLSPSPFGPVHQCTGPGKPRAKHHHLLLCEGHLQRTLGPGGWL